MRKLIASAGVIGVAAAPAAIALAAESADEASRVTGKQLAVEGLAKEGKRQLRQANAELRRERRAERRRRARRAGTPLPAGGNSTASPQLEAIAACESGGNPAAIGGGGQFRGKYQFTYETWAAVGGSGDPAAAPEAEQDRRAAILLSQAGTSPWPVCGG